MHCLIKRILLARHINYKLSESKSEFKEIYTVIIKRKNLVVKRQYLNITEEYITVPIFPNILNIKKKFSHPPTNLRKKKWIVLLYIYYFKNSVLRYYLLPVLNQDNALYPHLTKYPHDIIPPLYNILPPNILGISQNTHGYYIIFKLGILY